MKQVSLLLITLALTACEGENDPGPGGLTIGEARALDEAAEMIEARRLPAEALRPPLDGAPLPPVVPSAHSSAEPAAP